MFPTFACIHLLIAKTNIQTTYTTEMIQPKELLPKCINQQVKVITQYSTYYTGTLIAYDEFMNLILAGDVKERKLSSKGEVISSIGGEDKRVMICGFSVSVVVPGI